MNGPIGTNGSSVERPDYYHCMYCGVGLSDEQGQPSRTPLCLQCRGRKEKGEKLCPFCLEAIASQAISCPHCRESLDPSTRSGGTSFLAIISLVCGIIGCFYCIPGIAGVVTGLIALREIRKSPYPLKGRKMALWGVGVGIFWIVLWIVFAAWVVITDA